MNSAEEVRRDRELRLLNQHAFPLCFVNCSCERGCLVCAYTGLVSRAQAKQMGHRSSPIGPAPDASSF